jgi:uncharacterized protein YegL
MTTDTRLVVQRPSTPLPRWRPLPILLLDVSASMDESDPRRIDLLWEAVQTLRTPQARWRVAVFSHHCRWRDGQEIPKPFGNTDLADAFRDVAKVRPTSITLVTDGEPDDTTAAHTAGLALRLQEVGMIKSTPQKIIAQGTDWRFFNELKRELKG